MWHEESVTIDSVSLSYTVSGRGEPLVFLHGGGVNARSYRRLIELLSENYLVYAPDIPGFGGSGSPTGEWDFSDYGKLFSQWLELLDLDDLIAVGHSFGGGVALSLAAHSSLVKKVVVVDSAGSPIDETMQTIAQKLLLDTSLQALKTYKSAEPLQHWLLGLSHSVRVHWRDSLKVLQVVERCLRSKNGWLSTISVPTLLMWGDRDVIFPLESGLLLKHAIPNAEFKVVSGDHGWCLFEPERLVEKIMLFVS